MRRLLLATALAACSVPERDFAGLAPDAMPDASPAPGPDAMPFGLVSIEPTANLGGVAPATSITLTFNAAVDSAHADAVRLSDSRGRAVAGAVTVDGATVTFRPARPLALLAAYTTTVDAALQSTDGATLGAGTTATFMTRDGAWAASTTLVANRGFDCATAAIDRMGSTVATWRQSGVGGRVQTWTAVSGAPGPALLSIPDTAVSCPQLAMSRDGAGLALWTQIVDSSLGQNLAASRYTTGEGWRGPTAYGDLGRGTVLHAVTFDSEGGAHAVYTTYDVTGAANVTWARRWDRTTDRWGTAAVLSETDMAVSARLDSSAGGGVLAVWRASNGTVWSSRYRPALASWSGPALVATGDVEASAIDDTGNALVLWRRDSRVWARFYRADRASWEDATGIGNEREAPQDTSVALGEAGRGLAVWSDHNDEAGRGLWSRPFDATTGWGDKARIDSMPPDWATPPVSSRPQIAFDGEGRAVVVWTQSDGARERVWWNRRGRDGHWQGAAVVDDDTDGAASAPRLAVDRAGAAYIVWTSTENTTTNLRARRFE